VRVWRISIHEDLSGRGGELADGRWNRAGTPVVYCADHPSTTLLEMLVRIERSDLPSSFRLLTIDLPDSSAVFRIDPETLPANWRSDLEFTRQVGTDLLNRAQHLTVLVPCVIVPFAWNVLVNPLHSDVADCAIVLVTDVTFDPRLIR
jgi:RES domain-containing protein